MKLHELFNRPLKDGDVGIEIEVEFQKDTPTYKQEGDQVGAWNVISDGSLRNGLEYVSRSPFKVGPTLYPKLTQICDGINSHAVVKDSPRASVHVHVNVGDFTPIQVYTALCLWWMLEDTITLYCGKDTRFNNQFCLRASSAKGVLMRAQQDLAKSAVSHTVFSQLTTENKYTALNPGRLLDLNSLEIRVLGPCTDPNLIGKWAESCHHLIRSATKFKDPEDLYNKFWSYKRDDFIKAVCDPFFLEIITSTPDYYNMIRKCAKNGACVAFFPEKGWDAWQEQVLKVAAGKSNKVKTLLNELNTISSVSFNMPDYIVDSPANFYEE